MDFSLKAIVKILKLLPFEAHNPMFFKIKKLARTAPAPYRSKSTIDNTPYRFHSSNNRRR